MLPYQLLSGTAAPKEAHRPSQFARLQSHTTSRRASLEYLRTNGCVYHIIISFNTNMRSLCIGYLRRFWNIKRNVRRIDTHRHMVYGDPEWAVWQPHFYLVGQVSHCFWQPFHAAWKVPPLKGGLPWSSSTHVSLCGKVDEATQSYLADVNLTCSKRRIIDHSKHPTCSIC